MCGIAGFLDCSHATPSDELRNFASRMAGTLRHRGPDDEGVWVDGTSGIALAHTRLSILDLSDSGRQPMRSACGRYVIVLNGEIYNFRSLRAELKILGQVFRGHSDTEVMLAAISAWGLEKAIGKFNGMFAFALWDCQERQLSLGRDRLGEKPLYFGWAAKAFLFGSELKALRSHPGFDNSIDRDAVSLYLRHRCIPAPFSIYKGISKLMPGTILTLAAGRVRVESNIRKYWSAKQAAERGLANPSSCSAPDAADELGAMLADSVKLRMESDVPLGAFLSGGVDSSTVVAIMQKESRKRMKTFCLGFEEANEAVYAAKVAEHLGTDHTEAYITASDAKTVIPQIPTLYDEPFSDSSQIPTFLISALARRQVTVILTGDGGDELFCGYGRYELSESSTSHDDSTNEWDRVARYRSRISDWNEPNKVALNSIEPRTSLTEPACWVRTDEIRNQMMHLDMIMYLPDDLLVKLDRAAMGVGLETRTPFLDHRLIEYVWRLPFHMKMNAGVRKWILRQILYRHVPPSLIERPKQGFEVPLNTWLRNGLRDWAESLLQESRLQREGFLDARPIREKWDLFVSGQQQWKHHLWSILMFEAWLEQQHTLPF